MAIGTHTVSLVMPCRNEASHLAALIREVPDCYDEIICVSNRSTDGTYEAGLELEHEVPRLRMLRDDRVIDGIGYGFAHMTGIAAAAGDIIVCADSDGTYPIEDAPTIVEFMDGGDVDFVSCCRYPDPSIPWMLRLGVTALNIEIHLLYGYPMHDSLSGMWVFRRAIVPDLKLTEGDWNLSPQIKLNAIDALGRRFREVKVKQRVRHGETKQNYMKTGLRHMWWIACNRFKRH